MFPLPPFLDPDLQVSQRLVPILMSGETLTCGMSVGMSVDAADAHKAQNLIDASNDSESEIGPIGNMAACINSKGAARNMNHVYRVTHQYVHHVVRSCSQPPVDMKTKILF